MKKTKYDEYLGNAVAVLEEQYLIPASDAMARIMNGAKQVQLELFKDKGDGQLKLAVRSDGRIRVVAGELAVNSVKAIEKISGRANIIRDFLQLDTEKAMLNPTRDHASHGGFDITITALADGQYRMTFTAPDAAMEQPQEDEDPKRPSHYISRNDLKPEPAMA